MLSLLVISVGQALDLTEKTIAIIAAQYGASAGQRLHQWQEVMHHASKLDDMQKLELVNRFFNRIPYFTDLEHWGVDDYWATPEEFLASNGGDCEEYAIAKYLTLRKMGVSPEKLRIAYVKALGTNRANIRDMVSGRTPPGATVLLSEDQAHMVLTYYASPDAEPMVLDNLVKRIRPVSQRKDLVPVYSIDGDRLWHMWLAMQSLSAGELPARQKPWRDLLTNLRKH